MKSKHNFNLVINNRNGVVDKDKRKNLEEV